MKTIFGIIEKEKRPDKKFMFIKVLAEYENYQLTEVKNPTIDYPSEGDVMWSPVPDGINVGKLGFYTIEERIDDYASKPIYSKYLVNQEIVDLRYYEIVKIPFSLVQNKEITYLIQNGFDAPQQFTSEILLLTTDNFLIGPYRPKQTKELKWVADFNDDRLLEIRQNNMDMVKYYDKNVGTFRYFTSTMLLDTVEDYLDCATNERIIRYALKTLKDEKHVQDISRKVINQLSDLVSELPSEIRYERITRAIELLTKYKVEQEDIAHFEQELLQYPAIQDKIQELLEEKLVIERKKIENENKKIINETQQLRREKELLLATINKIKQQIRESEENLKKADEALEQKLKDMKHNIFQTLTDLIPFTSLGLNISHNDSNYRNDSQWIVKETAETIIYDDVSSLVKSLVKNLSMINIEEKQALLIAKTTLGAILFRKPIIFKGNFSFEISQVIGWTISGNDHLTIFPDIKNFSNQALISSFSNYMRLDYIKSVHLCQIENSSAELYLPSFLDYWKVSIEESLPELILISIKDYNELTDSFIQKLQFVPIIDTDKMIINSDIRTLRKNYSLMFGSIPSHPFIEDVLLKKKSSEFSNFLEVVQEVIPFAQHRDSFKKWFRLLEDESLDEDVVSIWVVKVLLQPYISNEQTEKILEELYVESIVV